MAEVPAHVLDVAPDETAEQVEAKVDILQKELQAKENALQQKTQDISVKEKVLDGQYQESAKYRAEVGDGDAQPLLDSLMARRRALEEAEAELASFRNDSAEANKVISEKKADLDSLKAETEQLEAQEKENREHDKKFLDELTEDLQAYEQLKEEEMKKVEAENKQKIAHLKEQSDLLKKVIAESRAGKSGDNEKENYHSALMSSLAGSLSQ